MRSIKEVMNRFTLLLLVVFLGAFTGRQESAEDANNRIKAIFLYNFTKYVEWPSAYKQGDFVVGILGQNDLSKQLETMAMKKKVGTQKITVKTFSSVAAINKCHMLYIPKEKSSMLGQVVAKLNGHSTLLITDKEGLARRGSAINFVIQSSKQRFELNVANAEKYNLKVSSNLAGLAIVVD